MTVRLKRKLFNQISQLTSLSFWWIDDHDQFHKNLRRSSRAGSHGRYDGIVYAGRDTAPVDLQSSLSQIEPFTVQCDFFVLDDDYEFPDSPYGWRRKKEN